MTKARKLPTKFARFDTADYLKSDEDIAAYLTIAAEAGDAAHFARALGTVARARNLSELARNTGMSRMGLMKSVSGDVKTSLDTTMKLMQELGLQIAIEVRPKKQKRTRATTV